MSTLEASTDVVITSLKRMVDASHDERLHLAREGMIALQVLLEHIDATHSRTAGLLRRAAELIGDLESEGQ